VPVQEDTAPTPVQEETASAESGRRWPFRGLTRWAIPLLLAAASLTPSLMPRTAVFQGLVTALAAWGSWVLLSLVVLAFGGLVHLNLTPALRAWLPRLALAAAGMVFAVALWQWPDSQQAGHTLVGLDPPDGASRVVVLATALGVLAALLGLSWVAVTVGHQLGRPLHRVMAARFATVIGVVVVLLLVGTAADRWVVRTVFASVDSSFDRANNGIPRGAEPPASPMRSGSEESLSPWDELGEQGRAFVSYGPTVEQLAAVTDREVRQPIRVYAGLDSDGDLGDLEELAELAVAELDRTGAFDRAVLCVALPTGRGWINPAVTEALEYLYAGDTAIVGMQYSYLPSPLAFLVDPERAKEAGETLFEAVHQRWSQLPESDRPRLVVYGESLGSTGIQAAFSGLADLRERTDGALFVGPPDSNTLWRDLVDRRDPRSSEVLPVYDGGATARFASSPEDLRRPQGVWQQPRVVFLQNPSDPVVWWSPRLAWQKPDWLGEARGHDVSPSVRWYPLVTFLQVALDMAVANNVPAGHGHRYGDFITYWSAIVPPSPDWSEPDATALARAIEQTGYDLGEDPAEADDVAEESEEGE
jgi:uncharacterized membrane protein